MLAEENRKLIEIFHPDGLIWSHGVVQSLASDYAIKSNQTAINDGKISERSKKIKSMSDGLKKVADYILESKYTIRRLLKEKSQDERKFREMHREIDSLKEQIKILEKANINLKNQIEL